MNDFPLARKRFGQHFLKDVQIINRIVKLINLNSNYKIVEIGAGRGALTAAVLKEIAHLEIVEIDRDLCHYLRQHYPTQVTVHETDALKFDFASLAKEQKLIIFGNLPYNISTPLLFHLLNFANQIEEMVFMLQKEVVERMCASANHADYGRLSVMLQYTCHAQKLFDITPAAFSPPPKVMSSIIKLKPYTQTRPHPFANDFGIFANLVNNAFQHRRKTLRNALKGLVSLEQFNQAAIDPQRRPETLTICEFVALSNAHILF